MRPEILNPLFTEITALKGVGPGLAKPLDRLGIARVVDAAFHLPTGFIDRLPRDGLDQADVGRTIAITLTPVDYRQSAGRGPTRVHATDARGNYVSLVYFGGSAGWVKKLLPLGEARRVSGRLEQYGQELQIVHPDYVLAPEEAADQPEREAIYPLSEGLTAKRMGQLARAAVERAPDLPEWIEPGLKARHGWPDWRAALARIHADPSDAKARERLAYDEIFANQLALMLVRAASRGRKGRALAGDGRLRAMLDLPYAPTGAQARSIAEIEGDLAQTQPMLRLLQGDVGSGKTLVAAMAMLIAVEAGAQAAFLAPTEILARQHFETLRKLLAGLPINLAILTGRDKGRSREATLMGLADGSIDILVGTHAIFQQAVSYRDLGLVVVDEQHRFGVAQRMLLTQKAERPPHLLAMTATPIPRTLALTWFGDMDVSILSEKPAGRKPIVTRAVSSERYDEVVGAIGRAVESGAQAYWVCPLVQESDTLDVAAAQERFEALREIFGAKVGLLHGQMPGREKDAAMAAFVAGETRILVSTTVIEVGVDVPNASVMVIEHAERFGLAQLHQLRGRIGRGSAASTCLLLYKGPLGPVAEARLTIMRETEDGFRIAEEDLRLRGEGEVLGTKQSGSPDWRIARPEIDGDLLAAARDDARLLIERDPHLETPRGQAIRVLLYLFERDVAIRLLRAG